MNSNNSPNTTTANWYQPRPPLALFTATTKVFRSQGHWLLLINISINWPTIKLEISWLRSIRNLLKGSRKRRRGRGGNANRLILGLWRKKKLWRIKMLGCIRRSFWLSQLFAILRIGKRNWKSIAELLGKNVRNLMKIFFVLFDRF